MKISPLLIFIILICFAGGITLLRGFHAAMKGERADMQDAHIIIDDLLPQISSPHPDMSVHLYMIDP